MDYTRLLNKLNPPQDGEPTTHLRVGTVDTVNSDGTLDILMSSGVIVPGVPRLSSVQVIVGSVVQMIGARGSLLVIGTISSAGSNQVVAYASETTDSVAGGSGSEVVIMTITGTLQDDRPYRVWAEFHATPGSAGVAGAVRIREDSGLAGTELRVAYADFPNAGTAGNHFLLSSRYTATATGSKTFSATAQATGATMRREAATTRVAEMWITAVDS